MVSLTAMPSRPQAENHDELPLVSVVLEPAPPYSWRHTLAAIVDRQAVPDRGQPTPKGGWRLALRLADRVASVSLSPRVLPTSLPGDHDDTRRSGAASRGTDRGNADLLELTLRGDGSDLVEASREVTRFLALDLDLKPLLAEARLDPAFAPVAAALHGFHPPLFRSAFQATCWTVVRQRTPQAYAAATMERLSRLLGEAAVDASDLWLFPSPAAMLQGRPELLAASNNVRKVDRLVAVAEAFAGFDEQWLRGAPYDESLRWLRQIHGVGPWSAEQVLWRGLGRHERAPWLDTGALTAVSATYAPGLTVVRGEARRLAGSYGLLQGVWLAYLKARARVQGVTGWPAPQ